MKCDKNLFYNREVFSLGDALALGFDWRKMPELYDFWYAYYCIGLQFNIKTNERIIEDATKPLYKIIEELNNCISILEAKLETEDI